MPTGAITGYIDVAQLVRYAFWIFFFALVFYIRREDKREGYPLETDPPERTPLQGFPPVPKPKVFRLHDGTTREAPRKEAPLELHGVAPAAVWPGAPLEPTGDPMRDQVGPGSYPPRPDVPAMTFEHDEPMIVPLRVAPDYYLETRDPDPRGMEVVAADGEIAGVVVEAWINRIEPMVHFFEVEVAGSQKRVLLPIGFAQVKGGRRQIVVQSITAAQFENVPTTASNEQITLLEEDRICAYFAGGKLYATDERKDPVI